MSDDFFENFEKELKMQNINDGISLGFALILIIICIIVVSFSDSVSISNERQNKHMVVIEDGYVYNEDTKIIYLETIITGYRTASKPVYTPYYNENGNKCKYVDGEWIEIN